MNQRELKSEIESKNLRNLYIFCSDDYFLKKLYRDRIMNAGRLDFEILEIEEQDDMYKIAQHSNSSKLFGKSDKRLVYARIHYVISKIDLENRSDNIIILDPIGCKNIKHKNLVKFDKPTSSEIRKFIAYKIGKESKRIENKAIDFLVQAFSNKDTSSLNIFLDKVLLYCKDSEIISCENIKKLEDSAQNSNAFKLAEYIMQKNQSSFFREIDNVLDSVNPSALIYILTNSVTRSIAAQYSIQSQSQSHLKHKQGYSGLKKESISLLLDILYEMDVVVKSINASGFNELFKARMFEWFNKV